MEDLGTLRTGEPHPAAFAARAWMAKRSFEEISRWQEIFASLALSENRLAEICGETLRRLLAGESVSDRYVLGLAWVVRYEEDEKKEKSVMVPGEER